MEFPETLIVLITTHGAIQTQDFSPISKTLEHPIQLYKLNASTYGVPFLCNADMFQILCSKIKESVDLISNMNHFISPLEIITKIKNVCITTNRENTLNILKEYNIEKQDNMNSYAHYSDLMFNIVQTNYEDKYIDKTFIPFQPKEIEHIPPDTIDSNYFNQIKLLNFHGINIFEMLKDAGHKPDDISLSELIDFLYNFCPMKNLVILDLTCSTTSDDKRTDRKIRRELIKMKMH
jgi:hypothetical protein